MAGYARLPQLVESRRSWTWALCRSTLFCRT